MKWCICGLNPPTRGLNRNKNSTTDDYDATKAQKLYESRFRKKKRYIRFTDEVQQRVNVLIQKDYSPEQIVGLCRKQMGSFVSHECIYQPIWADKKNGGNLYKHLITKGKKYRKRGALKDQRGRISNRVGIEERPDIVDKRERFGDLEMDLAIGRNHKKAILTINDRPRKRLGFYLSNI